ncbi:hypothetical protein QBC34DRAFT_320134 [Podospora aff. communis PSN243]|uniref:Uncharacterized protein n=1 Tax=Podospora aff. communis PSN243 TaxID=3040156 RepID=A0AAV9H0K0_9PEZI|nr:hypothetical protein QBC34DRAFT_320134 [Podospora aff. communis PSN243]
MASQEIQDAAGGEYRKHLPDLSIPRFTTMQQQDAHVYAKAFIEGGNPPWLHALYLHWLELLKEPFKGVTNDGHVRPNLFPLQDESIPIDDIFTGATTLLTLLSPDQRSAISYHIDSPEWRTWSNPEFLLSSKGIRLDEVSPSVRDAALSLLQTILSPEGYAKALSAMRINGFLGELVSAPRVCNELSYNLVFFGTPSTTAPWGLSLYGHHLCLSIFLHRTQIILSPFFTGAEPNLIDSGPHAGTRILHVEEALGLKLMQSLSPSEQSTAQTYKLLNDPAMPKGRWNHDDQRHLCGAYRDNRVVPYEGIIVSTLSAEQQNLVVQILEQYLLYLPAAARKIRLESYKSWFHETYFSWVGGYGDEDPFYYRIQSPVVIVEFDHHSGVFLTNKEPAKFHIHTLLRTPNGGDYGMALRPLIEGTVKQEFVWEGER